MNFIRQFLKVKGRSLKISLPEDFTAENVEVIIIPSDDQEDKTLSEKQKLILDQRSHAAEKDFIPAREALQEIRNRHGLKNSHSTGRFRRFGASL